MKRKILLSASIIAISALTMPAYSGWQDLVKDADEVLKATTGKDSSATVSSSLSNDEITKGLKEALSVGVEKAISLLGTENGFLNDDTVKILLPESVSKVEPLLRSAGQGDKIDDFVNSMNRAAEKAVPEVSSIFVDAISEMSLEDAQGILSGGDTAATDYFRKNTSQKISKLISPYVDKAMDSTDVTQYYKSMTSQAKKYDSFGLMDSYLGEAGDIDKYVIDKTMDGLFNKIALQEKMIRENPMARSTDILKSVFGSN